MAYSLNNVFRKSVLMVTVTIFLGCGGKENATEKSAEASSEKENFIPNPHMQGEQKKKILLEDITDKKSYDMPRIQFTSKYPKSDWNSLWSIKVDGTDLRKVMTIEEIHGEKGKVIFEPTRSLNNRYVAYELGTAKANERIFFDLKTRERTTMAAGSCKSELNWMPDGHSVMFGICGDLNGYYQYNVVNNEIKKIDISNIGRHIIKGIRINPKVKKIFIHGKDESGGKFIVGSFTMDWKKIKKVNFRHMRNTFEVSPDGSKFISAKSNYRFLIYDINESQIVYQQKRTHFSPIFSQNSDKIYASGNDCVKVISAKNGEILEYLKLPVDMSPYNLSLMNY